jgi:short subunit dehydrogenase-like uncharacterized protein
MWYDVLCCVVLWQELARQEGGVMTPASCQGMLLLKRLEETGSTFTWERVEPAASA